MFNENHIDFAKHCIGLNRHKPYTRQGKRFYKPYRNFFATSSDEMTLKIWEDLCENGFAKRDNRQNSHGGYTYWLTRKGLDWLGNKLNIKIYDEDE